MRSPPSPPRAAHTIAPRELARTEPRGREAPRKGRAPIARAQPRFFTMALALYVAVVVGRLHEVIPIFARLYFGKISLGLLVIALFVDGQHIPLRPALKTRTVKCLGIVTIVAILSVPTSFWPGLSVTFLRAVWPPILVLAIAVLAGFGDRRIALASIATLTIVAGIASAELSLGGGMVQVTNLSATSSESRAFIGGNGVTTYDSNYTAAFFVMVLPYALMFASRPGRMRWLAIPIVPALAIAMVKTGSRGGIVALAVLAICVIAFADAKHRKTQILILAAGVGVMLVAPHAQLAARFESLRSGDDYNFDSRDGRWAVWGRGLKLMALHPATGVGVGAFQVANGAMAGSYVDAHNAYVQIAAELGVPGISAFIVMITTALALGFRRRRLLLTQRANPPTPEQSLDVALVTAALCSTIAELSAAAFLSMAYEAMTVFALTVPVALAMRSAASTAVAGAAGRQLRGYPRQPASPPRIPGMTPTARFGA